MSGKHTPIREVAADLTPREALGWKTAEWEGEYYNAPDCIEHSAWCRAKAVAYGLVDRSDEDVCVTLRGEALIAYLNRSGWQRFRDLFARHLTDQEGQNR